MTAWEGGAEPPPRVGLGLLKRGLLAMVLVIAMSATALATTVILEIDDVKQEFLGQGRQQIDIPEVTRADAGRRADDPDPRLRRALRRQEGRPEAALGHDPAGPRRPEQERDLA